MYGLKNLKHNVTIISIDILYIQCLIYLVTKYSNVLGQFAFLIYQSVNYFNIFTAHLKITKADKSENTVKMKHKGTKTVEELYL